MAVFASDLRTRTPLRVFVLPVGSSLLPSGGSVAVCHPLTLRPHWFVTGDVKTGFKASFEGFTETYDRYGEAVEGIRCAITEIQRQGRRGRQYDG